MFYRIVSYYIILYYNILYYISKLLRVMLSKSHFQVDISMVERSTYKCIHSVTHNCANSVQNCITVIITVIGSLKHHVICVSGSHSGTYEVSCLL